MLTGHVTDPVRAMTKDAFSRYCTLITMPSALMMMISEHLSFISSLQRKKSANATKQPAIWLRAKVALAQQPPPWPSTYRPSHDRPAAKRLTQQSILHDWPHSQKANNNNRDTQAEIDLQCWEIFLQTARNSFYWALLTMVASHSLLQMEPTPHP